MSAFPGNATLTFQLPTGSREVDELGNPANTTVDFVVQAYLKEAKNQGKSGDAGDAGELAKISLQGRCVDPVALPAGILPGARAVAVLSDPAGIMPDQTGEFFLEATIASAFGVTALLGAPIRGYLVAEVAWGKAL